MTVASLSKTELLQDDKNNKMRWELKLDETKWDEIQRDAFYSDEALMKWEYIWVTSESDLSETKRDEDETW